MLASRIPSVYLPVEISGFQAPLIFLILCQISNKTRKFLWFSLELD